MISIPASRWIPESEPKTSIHTLGKLHDRMNVIDWSHILSETNPEVGYRDFIKFLSREIDDCCPKRIAKNKEQNSKWITLEIKQKCQIKRQLYEDMSNNLIEKAIYMEYRKNLDFEIRTLKKNCNSQYIMNSANKLCE
ncbi:hypothetical protein QE152_g34805 [Popillia japonica]|uniref:Uncharacterized protein n=1 Tax=Popillia japonica TaxID=7064 RepID=A0AAW1ISM3_POPJA